MVFVPRADVDRVADAHERCFEVVGRLTDAQVRRESLLPGWTVGHVLTHLARNADSHVLRAEAAVRGEMVDQYAGGPAGRAAAIEAGAGRAVEELVEDVRRSARAAQEAWQRLPPAAWLARSRDAGGHERYLFELPARRWQEVEVHLVDLDVGVTHADWPDAFVAEWLPRTRERMWAVLPADGTSRGFAGPSEELAWLYGRLHRQDLVAPPPWG